MIASLSRYAPIVLSLVRIVTGLLFLEHGMQKHLHFPPGGKHPAIMSFSGAAGLFELSCGALIAFGLFTRPAAFLASGVMAFAYFLAHFPRDFFPVNNGGDAAVLYCFVFFYFVFAGGGPLSLDALRGSRR